MEAPRRPDSPHYRPGRPRPLRPIVLWKEEQSRLFLSKSSVEYIFSIESKDSPRRGVKYKVAVVSPDA